MPLEFTQYHLNLECDEQIIKYRKQAVNKSGTDSLPVKKANAFKELKKTIPNTLQKRESLLELKEYKDYQKYESSSNLPLAQHQNSVRLFKPPPPASFQAAQTILNTAKRWSFSSG